MVRRLELVAVRVTADHGGCVRGVTRQGSEAGRLRLAGDGSVHLHMSIG
jgi:hypothetical protein